MTKLTKALEGNWTTSYNPADGFTIWYDPRQHGDMRSGQVVIATTPPGASRTEEVQRLHITTVIGVAPEMFRMLKRIHEMGILHGIVESDLIHVLNKAKGLQA